MKNFTNIIRSFIFFSLLFRFIKANEFISENPKVTYNFAGNAGGDSFGWSVSSAGDINNDGYDDMIIGAPNRNGNTGAAYIIYGGEESTLAGLDLSRITLDPMTTGFMITGAASGDFFGKIVSGAGDIDNDGYDDIIIGAYYKDNYKGAVYVIYGGEKSKMMNIDLSRTILDPTTTGFVIKGKSAGDSFGYSVSSAGDIHNDGYADIIIGAIGKNLWTGAAYVIYGGPKSSKSNIDLSTTTLDPLKTGFVMKGGTYNDHFGSSVSTAGDINKDGYADIIIGTEFTDNFCGTVYVIYGGEKSSMQTIDFSSFILNPAITGFTIKGRPNSYLGVSVSSAGDINNDGYADILIGAIGLDSEKGAVYVFYGREKSMMSNIHLLMFSFNSLTTGFIIRGATDAQLGNFVSCAGDINKDGIQDIVLGALWGKVYVVYGKKTGLSNIDLSNPTSYPATTGFMIRGPPGAQLFERSIASLDVNNDGFSDLLIGAPGTNSNRGSAYLMIYNECPQNCKTCPSTSKCTKCFDGYGLENSQCRACPENCKSCSTPSVCDVCSSEYYLFQGECLDLCPASTFPTSNGICQNCSVGCTQCESDSICYICSSRKYLFQAQCVDVCPASTFLTEYRECEFCSVGCTKCSSDSICDVCSLGKYLFQAQCVDTCPALTFPTTDRVCRSCPVGCIECTSDSVCQTCADGFTLSGSASCQPIQENKGEEASTGAFEGTSLVGAFLNSGSSLPLNFGMVAKILRNVKYLDITVSPELMKTFYSWKVGAGFMAAPKTWSLKSKSKDLPGVFSRYGLSPVFLINFWKPFVFSLIGLAIFMIFKCVEMVLTKKNGQKNPFFSLSKHVHIAASNFALTQFYSNLDDALLYFIIEVRSTKFDSGFRVFSTLLAVILLVIGGLFIGLHSKLLKNYQSLKQTGSSTQLEAFVAKCDNVQMLMKDFKDTTLFTQSFLLINLIRSVISSLIFAILFNYPLLQIILQFVLNILMIVYLLAKKPFKELFDTYGQLFCEGVLLIANICVFILAVSDHADFIDPTKRLSQCIIALYYILLLGCAVLLMISLGKILYKTYQQRKNAGSASQTLTVVTEITLKVINNYSVTMNQPEMAQKKGNQPTFENEAFAHCQRIQINYEAQNGVNNAKEEHFSESNVLSRDVVHNTQFVQGSNKRRMIELHQRSSVTNSNDNKTPSQEQTNGMDVDLPANVLSKRSSRKNKYILATIEE